MPKPLLPSTIQALNPPANVHVPYVFFADGLTHPFQPGDAQLNLRNAWWLADAALLAYSDTAAIDAAYRRAGHPATITSFRGARSTQCYVAATDAWIILSIRGTQVDDFWQSTLDWVANLNVFPVPDSHGNLVHAGFAGALDEVWRDVRTHLLSLQGTRQRPLWLTGHSLGAAVASIAASRCIDEPALGLAGLYTYGSPRAGDRGFGRRISVPVYRFRNDEDVVTHVPLGIVFRHVGAMQFIDSTGHLHRDVPRVAEMLLDAGFQLLAGQSARTMARLLEAADPTMIVPGWLADHAPINYAVLAWNAYERTLAR